MYICTLAIDYSLLACTHVHKNAGAKHPACNTHIIHQQSAAAPRSHHIKQGTDNQTKST